MPLLTIVMETPADLATYSGEQKEKKRFFGEYKPPRLACTPFLLQVPCYYTSNALEGVLVAILIMIVVGWQA